MDNLDHAKVENLRRAKIAAKKKKEKIVWNNLAQVPNFFMPKLELVTQYH